MMTQVMTVMAASEPPVLMIGFLPPPGVFTPQGSDASYQIGHTVSSPLCRLSPGLCSSVTLSKGTFDTLPFPACGRHKLSEPEKGWLFLPRPCCQALCLMGAQF